MTTSDEWENDKPKPHPDPDGPKTSSSDVPSPPPLPSGPEAGTANVRILDGFTTHRFIIPSLGLTVTQSEWLNVPQSQVPEIVQIASENQVLLEVDEGS